MQSKLCEHGFKYRLIPYVSEILSRVLESSRWYWPYKMGSGETSLIPYIFFLHRIVLSLRQPMVSDTNPKHPVSCLSKFFFPDHNEALYHKKEKR